MKITNINFDDGNDTDLMVACDTDGEFYISIDNSKNFYIKPSEWDSFIEKLQQAKQLLQPQEDESNDQ